MIKPFPKVENIHPIAIPFPNESHLISANLFALKKNPVTLIDTGPKFPGMMKMIRERLKLAGISLTDIERIIITHGHIDHFGLALSIQEAVGHPVQCFIHIEDQWRLSHRHLREEMWSREAADFVTKVGIPPNKVETIKSRFSFYKSLCDPLEDVLLMKDGDEFFGDGYQLKVIHTPGHSPGSCCLYESQHKILFSGDSIIKHITPNPLVELKRNLLKNPAYQSLKAYLDSLDKLELLDVRWVFPGHGEYIDDLKGIIASYKAHHLQRKGQVHKALQVNPRAIFSLIGEIFPDLPDNELFLAASDLWAHIEILINEDKAERIEPGPPALYRAL